MAKKQQKTTKTETEELARLRGENRRLSEALKMAEWMNEAKDVMIDEAEKTFNIPIRKNLVPNSLQRRSRTRPWAVSAGCLARVGRPTSSTGTC